MNDGAALSAVALVLCAVLVAAGLQRRGGLKANTRSAVIWAAIIIGVAVLLSALGLS